MIEFTIDKKEYKVGDLTIGQYYKLHNLLVMDDLASKMTVVSELSSCPQDELRKLDSYQFNMLWNEVLDNNLNIDPNTQPFFKKFQLKERTYYFIDMKKLTVGEMADMDILKSDPNKEKQIHRMMAVLYRPAKRNWFKIEAEDYDANTMEDRAEEFMDLPLKYVYGAIRFFLQVPRSLCETTLDSLMKTAKTKEEKEIYESLNQFTSELLGTGSLPSTSSLETILQKLEKLNEQTLSQHLTGLPIEKIRQEKNRMLSERSERNKTSN